MALHAAISKVRDDEDRWAVAAGQDGEARVGSAVAEVTDLVDLAA